MLPPERKPKTELNDDKQEGKCLLPEVFVLSSDSEDDDTCPSPEIIVPPKMRKSGSPEEMLASQQVRDSQRSESRLQKSNAPKLVSKIFKEKKVDEKLERGGKGMLTQRSWQQRGTSQTEKAKVKKLYSSQHQPIVPAVQIKREVEQEKGEPPKKKKGRAGEVKHGLKQVRQKKKQLRPGSFQHFDKVSKVLKIFKDKQGTLYALCEWQNSAVFYYQNNTKHFERTPSIVALSNVPDYQLTPFITYLLKSVEFRGELDDNM